MASTLGSMQADPLFEDVFAPTVPKVPVTGVEDALARLAHHVVGGMPDVQPRGPASDRSADARSSASFAAAAPDLAQLGPADLGTRIPHEQRSLGKRGILARVVIALCLGACVIWAWRAYGGPARDMIAMLPAPFSWITARTSTDQTTAAKMPDPTPGQAVAPPALASPAVAPPAVATSATPAQAPSRSTSIAQPATSAANMPAAAPADRQQIETMARDVAALRQTVERLAAGQEQLTRRIAKFETEKSQAEKPQADKPPAEKPAKRVQRHVSEPGGTSDVFDPAQNPTAPGVPRSLGSIVQRRNSP